MPLPVPIKAKRKADTRPDRVNTSIWSARMLAALGNGVKGGKWYSLMDKLCRHSTLEEAWLRVKRNRGAAGVDKMSIERFERQADKYLQELEEQLKAGDYKPQAVKRVYIPKSDGKQRPLGIPTVKDRVVQMGLKLVLEPIFEHEFLDTSFGFRPNRGCKDALRRTDQLLKSGRVWVVDADIQGYFDHIPHQALLRLVERRISDQSIMNLIKGYLSQDIMEGANSWVPIKGSPQGAVISPLLANIYLHELDREMAEKGFVLIRYADDSIALCDTREEAEQALSQLRDWMGANGLQLHPDKTNLGNCMEKGKGFDFLGYRFECGKRFVRRKSRKALNDKIREKTKRTRGKAVIQIIRELNPILRGWFAYFKHACSGIFPIIDGFIRRRLRAIKRKQEKRPGFGKTKEDHRRWPNAYFANLGLFTMKEAWEQASQSRCG